MARAPSRDVRVNLRTQVISKTGKSPRIVKFLHLLEKVSAIFHVLEAPLISAASAASSASHDAMLGNPVCDGATGQQ
jgi:hypothetical protein